MKRKLIELLNSLYDLRLFLKYTWNADKLQCENNYEAFLTKQYHIIEKGLALPSPRYGFGEEKIKILIEKTKEYKNKYGDTYLFQNIISVLTQYVEYHEKHNKYFQIVDTVKQYLANESIADTFTGGVKDYQGSNITTTDFLNFMKSRTSVRMFKKEILPNEIILDAINIAKHTPSVCNRQGWKAHSFTGELKNNLLKLQNGNRGFSDSIQNLIIVTGDIKFFSVNERNQINIDAGMFSMSLLLAFHSLGIGTCSLNACVSLKVEEKIKKVASIPKHEKVIMFIAAGYPEDNCYVAKSLRRESQSFITFHEY